MSTETDAQLVGRMRRGEVAAFEVIVRRHRAALVLLADAVLNCREDAEDVAQEAFVQAFFHLDDLRDPDALLPWLRRMTERFALMRRRSRREVPTAPDHLDRANGIQFGEEGTLRHVDVDGLLAELPEPMRQVVALTYVSGYTCAEAASMLGVKEGTVKSRLSRARAKLKEALAMPEEEKVEGAPVDDFTRRTIERLKAEARKLLARGDVTGAAARAQAVLAEQVKPLYGDPENRGTASTYLAAYDSPTFHPDAEAVAMIALPRKEQRQKECQANAVQYGFRLEELDWELADVDMMSGTIGKPTGRGKDVWGVPVSRMQLTILDARELCQRLRCSPLTLHDWVGKGCPIIPCWPFARFDVDRVQQWLAQNGISDWPRENVYDLERPIRIIFGAVYEGRLGAEQAEQIMSELGFGVWETPMPGFTGGWEDGCA